MEYQDCSDVQLSTLVRQGQGDAFAELSARYLGLIRAKAQRFEGAQALLNYGFATYALVRAAPQEALPTIPVTLGTAPFVQPVLGEGSQLLLEKSQAADLEQEIQLAEQLKAPVQAGDEVGQLLLTAGGEQVASVPLVAGEGVERLTYGEILVKFLKMSLCMAPFRD